MEGGAAVTTSIDAENSLLHSSASASASAGAIVGARTKRDVSLATRYMVLQRDYFKCVLCGVSPAMKIGCILHVDHIVPLVKGGGNEASNLRTLCENCNLGKGARS